MIEKSARRHLFTNVPRTAIALIDDKSVSISRLSFAAKGLLCALLFLIALPPAQAFEVNVEAKLVYAPDTGSQGMLESQSQAFARIQEYLDGVAQQFHDGRSYTVSNLHAEPTLSNYYTLNGVWYQPYYDLTICGNGTCNFFPNNGHINTWAVCPQGWSVGYHVDSPTSKTAYCGVTLPDAQPPTKCESCVGNAIYPSTGQKVQAETDYTGLPGLTFSRTYRSNLGFFASATTSTFADYSLPYGSKMKNCLPGYFTLSGNTETTKPYCYPYISIAQPKYQIFTVDGRHLRFSGPNTAVTQSVDVNERATQVTNASGAVEWHVKREDDSTEIYDAEGALTQTILRNGQVLSYSYSDASTPTSIAPRPGLLLTKTDAFGHTLSWRYDSSGRMVQMQDPAGGVYQYSYDPALGNMTGVTYPDGSTKSYSYNESAYTGGTNLPQALTGITDQIGTRFATFKFDSYARGTGTEHAGGLEKYTLSYAYSSPGAPATVVDPLGTSRTYQFQTQLSYMKDSSNSQPSASGSGTVSRNYAYDANGNLASKIEFGGNRTCFAYDLTRNLETVRVEGFASGLNCPANLASYTPTTGTAQRKISTTWHPSFRLPTSIIEANRTTAFTHDANGNVLTRTVTDTSVTPNVVRTWTYTYNSYGQVLTDDGPRTDATDVATFTYYTCTTGYQCGQLSSITNALGHTTTYDSYNAHGQPTQITDANGLVTSLAYDVRQRLTDRCMGGALPGCFGGELTHLDYWPTGLLKKVTNPDASYIEYAYDNAHRLTQINDGALNKIVYTLDNAGNRVAENTYDPSFTLKRTHSRVFNTLSQLWKDVNAAGTANGTTEFGYDNNGNQATTNAPLARNSSSLYDELNRLKQITDPNSGNTLFGYDANDNLTSVTDPRTLVTSYTYNGFGNLKTQASPDTGLTTNTYDTGGNLKTTTDARNAITTYTYDVMNRVSTAAFKIGSTTDQTITYTYDAGTNGKGHLTGASDANHALAWTYDARGRIIGKGQSFTGVTPVLSIGYGYNAQGQLFHVVLPSGKAITYGYNSNGQVSSVTLDGSPSTTILNNVTYDPFGPITGWTWGNGTASTSRTFDTDGKLTALSSTATVVGNRTFGYDDAFRITSSTDSLSASLNWTLGYDLLDRLNSATKTGTTIGYTYDANGNRLTQTGTTASAYTVAATSNKLSSTTGSLTRTYNYNASGSVLTSGATTHTYYNSGRMKTGKLGAAATTTYIYNALGQRIKKSGGAVSTAVYFMYDEAGHLLGEYNVSGSTVTPVQETVWLGDIPIATLRVVTGVTTVFYVHTDQLNTPRKVTNTADQLRWKWDPNPFGEGTPNENPASLGSFKYHLRFPGQYFDLETKLNYNYFRDYDPAIGRYAQSDPIGLKGGINTYAYVRGNPLSYRDPRGLAPPRSQPGTGFPALGIPGPYDDDWNRSVHNTGLALEDWISRIVSTVIGWCSSKADEDENECAKILEDEIDECYKQTDELGPGGDWIRIGCIDRAKKRFAACNRNGGTMPPDALEPWGDKDVDGWGRRR